jgi:hypothetical protein
VTGASPSESFLRYRGRRWLWLSIALVAACAIAYVAYDPLGGRHGDTPVGYAIGSIAGALMLWLAWFGVKKRSYGSTGAPLRGWLSAHVYLGLALPLLVPLHSAFAFGWNVHTLAYALVLLAVLSGILGVLYYGSVPSEMTLNRSGVKRSALLQRVAELDGECRALVRELPDVYSGAVAIAIDETRIGGGLIAQLRGTDPRCGTARALAIVRRHAGTSRGAEQEQVNRLLQALALKGTIVSRIRRDVQQKALLDVWLVVHVPLAIASIAALAVHVFVVLYW